MGILRKALTAFVMLLGAPAVLGMHASDEHVTCSNAAGQTIENVAEAFLQCTSRLEPYQVFSGCKSEICTLQERDVAHRSANLIAARVWPEVFDRLVEKRSWSSSSARGLERRVFFDELARLGRETLRNHCSPRLAYDWQVQYVKEERQDRMFFSRPMFIDVICMD